MDREKVKEYILVAFVAIVFITFLNFIITLYLTILVAVIITWAEWIVDNYSSEKKIKKVGKILFIILLGLIVIDSLSTYHAVHWLKFAKEMNGLVLCIWGEYGLILGEIIRHVIIAIILFLTHQYFRSKKPKEYLTAFGLIIFMTVTWFLVVVNNLLQTAAYYIYG